MKFTELCVDLKVTTDERMKLARYLATLRAEATLKLGTESPHEYHLKRRPMEETHDPLRSPPKAPGP